MSINLNDIITAGTAKFQVVKVATSKDIDNLNVRIDNLPSATDSVSGFTKLYSSTGNNTDGTITQSALMTLLNGKQAAGNYALASHGNHVPEIETANNAKFLRNDNTWQTVTPANIGAADSSHTHDYLPLSGGTMTGSLNYGSTTREIISLASTNDTWRAGLKYSWASNTTIALWGTHENTQFVWNAGTDFSTTDINGTTTRTYDFQVGRSNGVLQALVGGTPVSLNGHTHNYLPLSGGTMTTDAQIQRGTSSGTTWVLGRNFALIKTTIGNSSYMPIMSLKTTNGSWEIGHYGSGNMLDNMLFTYILDSNYNNSSNTVTGQINFTPNGAITIQNHATLNYNSTTGCLEITVS